MSIMTYLCKMSTKLIIHKHQSGGYVKHLQITIDSINDSAQPKYSKWLDTIENKRGTEKKATSVVVGIASEIRSSHLDLDSCAKKLNQFSTEFLHDSSNNECDENMKNIFLNLFINKDDFSNDGLNNIFNQSDDPNGFNAGLRNEELIDKNNPLDWSLIKVKANNAHIMENINILNKTLDYTKRNKIINTNCPKSIRSYPCEICGKCFVYETGLRRHYMMRHKNNEVRRWWQVVWTCIECFQVWPKQEMAKAHANKCCQSHNSDTAVKEIKTSLLLQCEFCEKVFTSIPRLLKHSKSHTVERNYECSTCDMAFPSYKMAAKHWTLCPWLNTSYTFCLSKMFLCNACDRKFKNYDQLYNHRFKAGHFLTKINSTNRSRILVPFVYQCEMCEKCYTTSEILRNHRMSHDIESIF